MPVVEEADLAAAATITASQEDEALNWSMVAAEDWGISPSDGSTQSSGVGAPPPVFGVEVEVMQRPAARGPRTSRILRTAREVGESAAPAGTLRTRRGHLGDPGGQGERASGPIRSLRGRGQGVMGLK